MSDVFVLNYKLSKEKGFEDIAMYPLIISFHLMNILKGEYPGAMFLLPTFSAEKVCMPGKYESHRSGYNPVGSSGSLDISTGCCEGVFR